MTISNSLQQQDWLKMDIDKSTSSQGVSLASPSRLQDENKASTMTVTSGLKCFALYKRQDPLGLLVKMLLTSSKWLSPARSLTWKVKDIPSKHLLFQLVPLGLHTEETAFLLLPTLTASDSAQGAIIGKADRFYLTQNGTPRKINKKGSNGSLGLTRYLKILPTLTATAHKGTCKTRFQGSEHYKGATPMEAIRIQESDPLYLGPSWAESFMGYPTRWTELKP